MRRPTPAMLASRKAAIENTATTLRHMLAVAGMSQTALEAQMKMTKGALTGILRGTDNIPIRLLSDIMTYLGSTLTVTSVPKRSCRYTVEKNCLKVRWGTGAARGHRIDGRLRVYKLQDGSSIGFDLADLSTVIKRVVMLLPTQHGTVSVNALLLATMGHARKDAAYYEISRWCGSLFIPVDCGA